MVNNPTDINKADNHISPQLMVNNPTNINKADNHISPQLTEHTKDHDI